MPNEKNIDELTPEELALEVDNVQEQISQFEGTKPFQRYLAAKVFQDTCAAKLRSYALEFGDFRSRYFNFQKVNKETTDWKAICRHLVETKAVTSKAMNDAIEAFTESKPYGKMTKVKDKDLSLKLA